MYLDIERRNVLFLEPMRAYFFNNMYLNGIHNGIQAGHAIDQMWLKYTASPQGVTDPKLQVLREFSRKHKTFIILSCGEHQDMMNTFKKLFRSPNNPYPFERFLEPGLNNTITSIGIVLPKCMYDSVAAAVGRAMMKADDPGPNHGNWEACMEKKMLPRAQKRNFTDWERQFLKFKTPCGLAK